MRVKERIAIKTDLAGLDGLKSLSQDTFLQSRLRSFSPARFGFGLLLHIVLLFITYYISYQSLSIKPQYYGSFAILLGSYLFSCMISGKAFINTSHDRYEILRKLNLSFFLTIGLFVLFLLVFQYDSAPRIIILSALVSGITLEALYYLVLFSRRRAADEDEFPEHTEQSVKHPFRYVVVEFGLLLFIIALYRFLFLGSSAQQGYESVLYATILIGWVYAGMSSHRFNITESAKSILQALLLLFKGFVILFALTALAVYYLKIPNPVLWLGSIGGYAAISTAMFFFVFSKQINGKTEPTVNLFLRDFEERELLNTAHKRKYCIECEASYPDYPVELEHDYLKDYPEVFLLINRALDLSTFSELKSRIRRTGDVYNFEILKNQGMELLVNLQKINDIRQINYYLRTVNKKLVPGGVFVSCVYPNVSRFQNTIINYPGGLGHLIYFFDFLWRRVCIKLPVIRKFYFWVTKGKDRAISLAETLGRLVYNGFEIIDLKLIHNNFFFIAKKIGEPLQDSTIKHRFFFRMKRVGLNGKEIVVYKVRTMHPYSEYIQKFLYERSSLEVGGKFRNDFRITSWGTVFRKLWIDELPMILNMVKGELKLVGVRPLSSHYLSLYSEEYRNYRLGFKPGLIPPYYADMPETIEEIEESERRYLNAYEKAPLRTDISYFLKAAKNIVLKGKRSA